MDDNQKIISCNDAKQLGLKYYFTGKPCKFGHIAIRIVSSETCRQCSCERNIKKHYESREINNRRMRVRYWSNREKELEWAKKYYERNRETLKEKARKWRAENPELARETLRKSYSKHRKSNIKRNKEWYSRNPESKAAYRNMRLARKLGNGGYHTGDDVKEIFEAQRNRCAYCKTPLTKKKRHIDHIIPLSRGGTSDRKNIQILCVSCNLRKHARDPIDHARSLGKLL